MHMLIFRCLLSFLVFSACGLWADQEKVVLNTQMGQDRVLEIMYQGPSGVMQSYKNCTFAGTKNLTLDLNLQETVTRFHTHTLIGKSFFFDALDNKLLSPQDKTHLLSHRQHGIEVISSNLQLQKRLQQLLDNAAKYEALFIEFMQKKQDALDALPTGFFGKFCAQSKLVQAYNQISLAIPTMMCAYLLYKIAPYHAYFYTKPADLIKDKKESDFIVPEDVRAMAQTQASQELMESLPQSSWKDFFKNIRLFYKAQTTPEVANFYKKFPDTMIKACADAEKDAAKKEAEYARRDQQLAYHEVRLVPHEYSGECFSDADPSNWANRYYPSYEVEKANFMQMRSYAQKAVWAAYGVAYAGVGALAYRTGSYGYQMYKVHLEGLKLRDALYAMNQLIAIAEEIELLCKRHGITTQFALSSVQDATTISLLNSLKSYPYNSDAHFFVPSSVTRTFMYEVYEKDMCLAPVFAVIAEMDTLHAFADKIMTSKNSAHKFCFAQFVQNKVPSVHAVDYWSVLVKKAVPNTLTEDRKVILTGPNAGGKSTTIRALLQNIVFAQTFGIAAAKEFGITQFDLVHSFINVSDDILGGKSLFATEVARAHEILTYIKKLPSSKKYFFALDELFTGTNAEDGEMCAYKFIENIANFGHVQFIYATHFNKLKEFGYTNDNCANYKIDAPLQNEQGGFVRDSKGKLCYPYTLTPGANNISVAKEIAYDAGLF